MLFNSPQFLIFFIIVYGLYLVLPHRAQNRMLLLASCFFYASWDWRFLGLLIFTAGVDFLMASGIRRSQQQWQKKLCVALTVIIDFGILGFFKYFNFFAENFKILAETVFGWSPDFVTLNIILPVGISFYTFQSMSYVTDVYYGRTEPLKKFPDFLLFVTYFPQLVAGPIERAQNLASQILRPRVVTRQKVIDGLWLIFWGLFKKVVIADSLAPVSDRIFNLAHPSGPEVLIGIYAFALQIYGDFAGYSDMARGLGKMMGFEIMLNFKNPYFVTNPRDFWRHWHISLSEWLRDNLYIPLGGNRKGPVLEVRNLMITMMLGGLWHGANWTFVLWGAYHGILLVIERVTRGFFQKLNEIFKPVGLFWHGLKIFGMFQLTCLGWLFFRARSAEQIRNFLQGLTHWPDSMAVQGAQKLLFYTGLFAVLWALKKTAHTLNPGWTRDMVSSMTAGTLAYFILFHGVSSKAFIYFQF